MRECVLGRVLSCVLIPYKVVTQLKNKVEATKHEIPVKKKFVIFRLHNVENLNI